MRRDVEHEALAVIAARGREREHDGQALARLYEHAARGEDVARVALAHGDVEIARGSAEVRDHQEGLHLLALRRGVGAGADVDADDGGVVDALADLHHVDRQRRGGERLGVREVAVGHDDDAGRAAALPHAIDRERDGGAEVALDVARVEPIDRGADARQIAVEGRDEPRFAPRLEDERVAAGAEAAQDLLRGRLRERDARRRGAAVVLRLRGHRRARVGTATMAT